MSSGLAQIVVQGVALRMASWNRELEISSNEEGLCQGLCELGKLIASGKRESVYEFAHLFRLAPHCQGEPRVDRGKGQKGHETKDEEVQGHLPPPKGLKTWQLGRGPRGGG